MKNNRSKKIRIKLKNKNSKTSKAVSEHILEYLNKYQILDVWQNTSKITFQNMKNGFNYWKKKIEENK